MQDLYLRTVANQFDASLQMLAGCLEQLGGDRWLSPIGTRAEIHLYNLRHVQHHTGQLCAALRQQDVGMDWVAMGAMSSECP